MKTTCFVPLLVVVMMSLAASGSASASYRAKAAEQTAYIQSHFYDPAVSLYRASYPRNPRSLPYDFMWGNGVQFTALVSATKYNPATYRPILYAFARALREKYWVKDAPVPCFEAYWVTPGSTEHYYDDNQWLVIGLAEAYGVTKDKMFLDWARETNAFSLSGWDDKLGGGIYWKTDHKSKNTCSNAPGATAAMCLYGYSRDRSDLDWATRIHDWTRSTLRDADGLYWDNIDLSGRIEKTKWTYNTALMIRTELLLYGELKDKQYLAEARRSADAGIAEWVDPQTGAIANSARFSHLFSEALLRLYDVTKDVKYLNVVRRHAAFGYRYVRDPRGGYWNAWAKRDHPADERKDLIENAATARLFWLLAPYPEPDELLARGKKAAAAGDNAAAEKVLKQAVASDDGAIEARYRLWKVLTRLRKTSEAEALADTLAKAAEDAAVRAQLTTLGWTAKRG